MVAHHTIIKYLESKLSAYLELLCQMVEINSFTGNPDGVNLLGRRTAEIFAPLGFQVETIQSTNPGFGRHLFLTRSGNPNQVSLRNPSIALISHLDTVFPLEEETRNDFIWRRIGNRIYGPGTVDIKGGTILIYMVLDALRKFHPQVYDLINWHVYLNASEEALGEDFGELCLKRLPDNTLGCLVFEGGRQQEKDELLVVARKGRATFQVQVEGRAAHSGNRHAQGANAIVQLAHTIQQIAAFTDYRQDITFNVGTVHGGSVVNRVPHYAEATVEMRAFSQRVFQAGYAQMMALNGSIQVKSMDGYPCSVSVNMLGSTSPWAPNPKTERLFHIWSQAANEIDMHVAPQERGGLSDANYLWQHIPTLDGLGPRGANSHCSERSDDGSKDQEYILVDSMVSRALLNIQGILKLTQTENCQ